MTIKEYSLEAKRTMSKCEYISRDEALKNNQKWYFTNETCKNGHIEKRYVNTGICYGCKRIQNQSWRIRNKEVAKSINKRAYNNNKENYKRLSRKWVLNNPEKVKEIKKKNKLKYKDLYLERECIRNKNRRISDPYWRLSKNVSKGIWESLKNKKNNLSWLNFVDYSLEELITHLELKFDDKMNWDNYGSYWHLDHIKPLSWFNLELEFKEAWALENLQPLEAIENLKKGNRYEG